MCDSDSNFDTTQRINLIKSARVQQKRREEFTLVQLIDPSLDPLSNPKNKLPKLIVGCLPFTSPPPSSTPMTTTIVVEDTRSRPFFLFGTRFKPNIYQVATACHIRNVIDDLF